MSKEWFASLKVGDEVAQNAGFNGYRIVKVDRTTATQVIVGASRYSKRNGYVIGSSGYSRSRIYPVTDSVRKHIEFADLCRWANNENWCQSTIEQLRAMKIAHDAAGVKP